MTLTVSIPICDKCGEPLSGHRLPFSEKQRSCEDARLYRQTPDSYFCRHPEICSKTKQCEAQQRHGRACND